MKRVLALVMMVVVTSACGVEGAGSSFDADSVEQAVVLEPFADSIPFDPGDLAACIDVPENLTAAWISERLVYNRSCFQSWSVDVGISCALAGQQIDGSVRVAGDAMASVPERGLLIRTRAAAAALIDIANLASGDLSFRADVDVGGEFMAATACAGPVPAGVHGDASLAMTSEVLGDVDVSGAIDLTLRDQILSIDYDFGLFAAPATGPVIEGQLTGTGIQRDSKQLCAQSGEVRFAGSIGGRESEVVLSWIGDGQGVITLPDGTTVGPDAPPRCE